MFVNKWLFDFQLSGMPLSAQNEQAETIYLPDTDYLTELLFQHFSAFYLLFIFSHSSSSYGLLFVSGTAHLPFRIHLFSVII